MRSRINVLPFPVKNGAHLDLLFLWFRYYFSFEPFACLALISERQQSPLLRSVFLEIILVSFLLIAVVLFKNAPNNRLNRDDKAVRFNTDESGFLNLMTCFCLIKENQRCI